jgi:hypothetical protein
MSSPSPLHPLSPDGAWKDFRDDLYWEALEGAALGFVLVIRQGGAAPGRGWELVAGRMTSGLVQLPQESRGSGLRWERSRWRHRLVDPASPRRPHVEHPWRKVVTKGLVRELVLSSPRGRISGLVKRVSSLLDARMDTALLPGQRGLERWGVVESGEADGLGGRYGICAQGGDLIDRATGLAPSPGDLIDLDAHLRARVDAALGHRLAAHMRGHMRARADTRPEAHVHAQLRTHLDTHLRARADTRVQARADAHLDARADARRRT